MGNELLHKDNTTMNMTQKHSDTQKWTDRDGWTDRQTMTCSIQAADTIPLIGVDAGFFVTEILGSDLVSGFNSGFCVAFGSGLVSGLGSGFCVDFLSCLDSVLGSGLATATGTILGSVDSWGLGLGASGTADFRTSLDKTKNY